MKPATDTAWKWQDLMLYFLYGLCYSARRVVLGFISAHPQIHSLQGAAASFVPFALPARRTGQSQGTKTALQENDGQFRNNTAAHVLCVNVAGNRKEFFVVY